MKQKIIVVVLLVIFWGSVSVTIYRVWQERQALAAYKLAEELVKPTAESAPPEEATPVEPDAYAVELAQIDFSRLQEINPEVVGWIMIPGTEVNYPLVQGEDNTYYLEHTWEKKPNSAGAIVLESTNSADFDDFSTIVYGHLMKNDSMFGGLKRYKEQDYFQEHSAVYIANKSGVWRYAVFAVYEAGVTSRTYYLEFPTAADKREFINHSLSHSVIESGIVPETDDQFLTLSTCTGNGYSTRWVVQTVLDQVFEK